MAVVARDADPTALAAQELRPAEATAAGPPCRRTRHVGARAAGSEKRASDDARHRKLHASLARVEHGVVTAMPGHSKNKVDALKRQTKRADRELEATVKEHRKLHEVREWERSSVRESRLGDLR